MACSISPILARLEQVHHRLTASVSTSYRQGGCKRTAAAALLAHATRRGWSHVEALLRARPDLTRQVFEQLFYSEHFLSASQRDGCGPAALAPEQLGLLCLLFGAFPPEEDPRRDGAYRVTGDDSARQARSTLVSWLAEQGTPEAISTLQYVEARLGNRYRWIRSARVEAERRFRTTQWLPLGLAAIGAVLQAADRRLIRSEDDGLDAVVEAIQSYDSRLAHDGIGDRDDFWNRPHGAPPSPKEEERASEKVCASVRDYLRDYAVWADREVQVVRRLTPADVGGAAGSRPDVLCRVPAAAAAKGTPISIPIEVKLSFNPEARTGLREQLAGRSCRRQLPLEASSS